MSEVIDWRDTYPLPAPARGESHVRVNFVTSADGSVTLKGRSGGLGGEHDRELMAVLRTLADVVLVGAGTVRAEGYGGLGLPSELTERRQRLGLAEVPQIAIVSRSLDLSPGDPVFTHAEVRPVLLTHSAAPTEQRNALAEVADVVDCGESEVDLELALARLRELGLSRVLCEGGPGLFGDLLQADLVDEVCLTISPLFVAGDAGRIARSPAAHPRSFHPENVTCDHDGFVFLRYVRTDSSTALRRGDR